MTTKQTTLGLADPASANHGPVQCLGMTFETDDARRTHFLERLREKLQDPAFRSSPGFPDASDEDILRLSDPPFYTACPNPFLADIVKSWREETPASSGEYHREPFCSDVAEGKGGRLYKAHTYHTKVPPEAIAKYILHYTEPGDVVLDGFAGSGMTGLGAALCAYPDKALRDALKSASWGPRRAILVDLSPFATFLSFGANSMLSTNEFEAEAKALVDAGQAELGEDVYGDTPAAYVRTVVAGLRL